MADDKTLPIKMSGTYSDTSLEFVAAIASEGINKIDTTTLEFRTKNKDIDLNEIVGSTINLLMDVESGTRDFSGLCVGVEYVGDKGGLNHYIADLRPWVWFLTRNKENRVFQAMSVVNIVREILTDYGFWPEVKNKLSDSYDEREYCVQYRESDFDFINRLMEEEGLYYFFEHDGSKPQMVLADSPGAHDLVPEPSSLEFHARDGQFYRHGSGIWDFRASHKAQTGKVTLRDYNFEKPKADTSSSNAIPTGKHEFNKLEVYHYPGHFQETKEGDKIARVLMESKAAGYESFVGAGNVPNMEVGKIFDLSLHPLTKDGTKFVATKATHYLRNDVENSGSAADQSFLAQSDPVMVNMEENYGLEFEAIPKDVQYRAPKVTPWPEIVGVQTAVVTGPSDKEIYTDKYGRVKIQFHWDRIGEKDETSSCFVRTMMPWTGKQWGMIAIPRIGQEVVVQFEEGNPDRPLVIGMLYNADTMPPYALPEKATQSGVKTNSSKGGSGFNELMFEDKKNNELVRFQAETNYEQIVKNNAKITVGSAKQDDGDMELTVHNDLIETVTDGNHNFTVAKGKQDIAIKKDKTEEIEGKSTLTVNKDVTTTVKQGNVKETVKMGNVTRNIDMGNVTNTLKIGNFKTEAKAGKITFKAIQGIDLLCGASKIKITPASIKIESVMVQVEAKAMVQIKGALGQVQSQGPLIIKGLPTMIN